MNTVVSVFSVNSQNYSFIHESEGYTLNTASRSLTDTSEVLAVTEDRINYANVPLQPKSAGAAYDCESQHVSHYVPTLACINQSATCPQPSVLATIGPTI